MTRRRAPLHAALAALTAAALLCPSAAGAAATPFVMRWRAQGEVGGDRGGRSSQTVLSDTMRLESVAGGYRGSIAYSDRVVIQDVTGVMLVQVSRLALNLAGAPAAGGTALAGTFDGTAKLDTYAVSSFADAQSGRLPARPDGTVTYDVRGHWGAQLTGTAALGEVAFGSATLRDSSGQAVQRDAGWFMRSDAGTQQFRVEVLGATPPPAGEDAVEPGPPGAAPRRDSVLDYVRRGLAGAPRNAAPVPAESAAMARALRDARPIGATPMPANAVTIDLDIAGHTLDAKNRACDLDAHASAAARARATWTGESAAPEQAGGGSDAISGWLDGVLATSEVTGARELRASLTAALASSAQSPLVTAARVREWYRAVQAVQATRPASVLAAADEAARTVAGSRVESGPLSDALLAAADAFDAPIAACRVADFESAADTYPGGPDGVVAEAFSSAPRGGAGRATVSWFSAAGAQTAEPEVWLAYVRADSTVFWLAGADGPVALTDGTVDGWGFAIRRAYLVDATRVGRLLAILPVSPATE